MTVNKTTKPRRVSATRKKAPVKKKKNTGTGFKWKLLLAGIMLILLSPFYYGYVLKTFSATWQWIKDIGENPEYRTYSSFGIHIPAHYSIHGIDVSYAQGKIDWQKVKDMKDDDVSISFAFIKATEGLLTTDPYFQRNWREGPKAGIFCGAYHFFRPKKDGKLQARFFLQNVTLERGDLLPVVDIETLDGTSPSRMRKELRAFLNHIEKKTGFKPIIYSGLSFYRDYLLGEFDGYPLWIAHYYQPALKVGKNIHWKFWQHSDKARVNGINHVVDFNVFKGDSTSFEKMLIQ